MNQVNIVGAQRARLFVEVPGSTSQGQLRVPLEEWAVVLADDTSAQAVIEGDLAELEVKLEQALAQVRRRRDLLATTHQVTALEVPAAGCVWSVPASVYSPAMTDDEVAEAAIRVREGLPV